MLAKYGMSSVPAEYIPVLLMCAGGCCFSTMDVFAKLLTDVKGIPAAPVAFSRMIVTAVLASLYMKYQGIENPVLGPPGVRGWLLMRGLIGGCGLFFFYNCLQYLHLADALSIWFMAPILTSILAAIALHEAYTLFEGFCGAISSLGVVCVVRPPFLFGSSGITMPNQILGFAQQGLATLCGAIVFVIVRHIGKRCNALFFVSYFGYISATIMALIMLGDETQRPTLVSFDLPAVFYLVALSFTGFLATYMQNMAMQMAKVGRLTLYLYVQVPLVLIFSWAVFGDALTFLGITGCGIIVGCAIAITLYKDQPKVEGESESVGYDRLEQEDIEMPLSAASTVKTEEVV